MENNLNSKTEKNIDGFDIEQFVVDFNQTFFDTIIKAPFYFGMFIGNLSGLAGKEQQNLAFQEIDTTIKAVVNLFQVVAFNKYNARELVLNEFGDYIIKELLERPGRLCGAFAVGRILGKVEIFSEIQKKIKFIDYAAILVGKYDIAYHKTMDKIVEQVNNTKIDNLIIDNDNEKQKFENNLNDIDKKTKIYFHSQTKTNTFDPLVLDLNNNGRIDTITLNNSKAFFDHNNDNIAYKSSWISKDDGLLVLDKNNNNLIDNGNELFGNFTEISSNSYALNGFEALKLLDSNEDGVIDINDKEFNNLKVWQDLNEDGITQINELKSLKDLNITSINLNYKDTNQKLDNDNTITQTATFIKDGKESLLADINFSVSSIERVFKDKIIYSEEELNLANLKGYGVLRDLRDAACLDEELKALLKDYSLANSKEEQLNKLDSLIYSWANTNKALNKDFNLSKTKEFDSNNPNNTDSIRDLWLTPSQAREYANFTISESLKNEFNELKYA